MKLNKTLAIITLVAGSLLAGNALMAQDAAPGGGGGRGAGGQRPPRATPAEQAKTLGLDADQTTKFVKVMEDVQKKMEALRSDTNTPSADRRTKMQEIMTARTAEMKKILTAEQFTKWEATSGRGRGPGGQGGGRGGNGGGSAPKAK